MHFPLAYDHNDKIGLRLCFRANQKEIIMAPYNKTTFDGKGSVFIFT